VPLVPPGRKPLGYYATTLGGLRKLEIPIFADQIVRDRAQQRLRDSVAALPVARRTYDLADWEYRRHPNAKTLRARNVALAALRRAESALP
jgi:hypothetical protein